MSYSYQSKTSYSTSSQPVTVTSQPYAVGGNTVVVTTQPVRQKRDWSTGLFDCFQDMGVCLLSFFFGPCYTCYIAHQMGEHCCVGWCVPNALIPMRSAIRERHGIQGSICDDCVCATFCGECVLCQMARELKATGDWRS